MSKKDIKVPNIGEFSDVEVIEILVKKGQKIKRNDPLITIESDKSSVEIPSTYDGNISSVNIKVGDKVSEGDKILEVEIDDNLIKKKENDFFEQKISKDTENEKNLDFDKKTDNQNLIFKKLTTKTSASPKVRKFARELGIDISKVKGSERQGRITESDIKLFISSKSNKTTNNKNENNIEIKQEFSHSEFGNVEIKDIPRVKRLSSKYLINSWTSIPHVTNHDEADITELEEFRTSLLDIYTGEKKRSLP